MTVVELSCNLLENILNSILAIPYFVTTSSINLMVLHGYQSICKKPTLDHLGYAVFSRIHLNIFMKTLH